MGLGRDRLAGSSRCALTWRVCVRRGTRELEPGTRASLRNWNWNWQKEPASATSTEPKYTREPTTNHTDTTRGRCVATLCVQLAGLVGRTSRFHRFGSRQRGITPSSANDATKRVTAWRDSGTQTWGVRPMDPGWGEETNLSKQRATKTNGVGGLGVFSGGALHEFSSCGSDPRTSDAWEESSMTGGPIFVCWTVVCLENGETCFVLFLSNGY